MYEWVGGKPACVDFTGVSPLVGLRTRGFNKRHATLKTISCKVVKHEKACCNNQHTFIPFAYDTFNFRALEVVILLQRVRRLMHNHVVSHRAMYVAFKRIDLVIQKRAVA